MRTYKPLVFLLLTLSLVIRPVLAEGFMVHNTPAEQTTQPHNMMQMNDDMSNHMHHHMHSQMSDEMSQNMPCCDEGIHFCQNDCNNANCLMMTSVSATQPNALQIILSIEHSQTLATTATQFTPRFTPPELRPPLLNA